MRAHLLQDRPRRRGTAGRGCSLPDAARARPGRTESHRQRSAARVIGLAAAAALAVCRCAQAQTIRQDLYRVNGSVDAAAVSGGTLYIGGEFNRLGPVAGPGAVVDRLTGRLLSRQPQISSATYPGDPSSVASVVADGANGWFIGGDFTQVNGVDRIGVAHLLADGSLSSWDAHANGAVSYLALSGNTLYASGRFSSIGGQPRRGLAALDAATGVASAWDPNAVGDFPVVPDALLPLGGKVYVRGYFFSLGGQPRNFLAALDAVTGAVTDWDPEPDDYVYALAASESTVYASGYFSSIGGQARSFLAALDTVAGAARAWDANADNAVQGMIVSGNTLYASGYFSTIGGQARYYLAALDPTTGLATNWNPQAHGVAQTLVVRDGTVYVGGWFAADSATGIVTAWDPAPGGYVASFAVGDDAVFLGGSFDRVNDQLRQNLAAIDLATGMPMAWSPHANSTVSELAVSGGTVYAGGAFTSIDGQPRSRIAALDATTGAVRDWDPGVTGRPATTLNALALGGGRVYVGGVFDTVGGKPRHNLAMVDSATGAVTDWDPSPDDQIRALVTSGRTVFAGGYFVTIGGQARRYIAALDTITGAATPWDARADAPVYSLAAGRGTVYAGGDFTSVGGQSRSHIAALDAMTGGPTAWNPGASDIVQVLAASWETVYASGQFQEIGGQARNGLAALDATTGAPQTWNPDLPMVVRTLAVGAGEVCVGGFSYAQPPVHFVAIADISTPSPSLVSAEVDSVRVHLAWMVDTGRGLSFTVYRRASDDGWLALSEVRADGAGQIVFDDVHVQPGGHYRYRLGVSQPGQDLYFDETAVDVPLVRLLSLSGLVPNPATRGLRVSFSLQDAAPARLLLLDISGRRILERDVGSLGPGRHVLQLSPEGALPKGIYLLRLTQGNRSISAKAAVIR